MIDSLGKHYLDDALAVLRNYKALAEKALEQLNDEEFFVALDEEANSVGVIVKHMSGNMVSRWTDFLTSDGEKPDRNRDMEFVVTDETSRSALMEQWERGWRCVFGAIEPLQPEDLQKKIFIRGEEHSVLEAINRQLTHYAYHTGQIVFLAKHLKSAEWKWLSIPRNRSAEFNAHLQTKDKEDGTTRIDRFNSVLDVIRDK